MDTQRSDRMIGESSNFLETLERVSQLAPLNKPVLVIGERGTGKELIGSRIHYLSERWGQPFLKLNCAAISESLMDSELFGHEAGSFSGATKQHKGLFEQADGGTLFLDELATTSMQVQEKILRVIEYGELTRVGGSKTIAVDVRLVAATNGNLPEMAKVDKFRADLLDRLAFDVITLPPLRYRQEDIPILAEFFALGMTKDLNRDYFSGFSRSAMAELLTYPWPGNVRELKNVVERSVYRQTDPEAEIDEIIFDPFLSPFNDSQQTPIPNIDPPSKPESLHEAPSQSPANKQSEDTNEKSSLSQDDISNTLWANFLQSSNNFKEHIENIEVALINNALRQSQFNQKKTAELLGLTYHQLRGYLRKYQIGGQ